MRNEQGYLDEFAFRHNRCKANGSMRLGAVPRLALNQAVAARDDEGHAGRRFGMGRGVTATGRQTVADRRNGSYRRRILSELGDTELSMPCTRTYSPAAMVRAYASATMFAMLYGSRLVTTYAAIEDVDPGDVYRSDSGGESMARRTLLDRPRRLGVY